MQENISHWPCLATAVLCERVLQEKDNVLTLIRLVDRFTIPAEKDSEPSPGLKATMLLSFKSGNYRGKLNVRIDHASPTEKRANLHTGDMTFEGGEKGAGIIANITLVGPEDGLHWFEVVLKKESSGEEICITRVPMTVHYKPKTTQAPAQG